MTHYIHMQDQVRNRIDEIMENSANTTALEEFVQTAVSLGIVFVFLAFGLNW